MVSELSSNAGRDFLNIELQDHHSSRLFYSNISVPELECSSIDVNICSLRRDKSRKVLRTDRYYVGGHLRQVAQVSSRQSLSVPSYINKWIYWSIRRMKASQ